MHIRSALRLSSLRIISAQTLTLQARLSIVYLKKKLAIHRIQYLLKWNDELVATGGFMLNYNMPYADIYYEVLEQYRHRGLGTFFIQELKKAFTSWAVFLQQGVILRTQHLKRHC